MLGGHIGFLWDSNPQDGEEELGGHVVHHRWASHQMAQKLQRLTALAVTRLSKPGLYADGGGLYLRVGRNGSKGWTFRFTLHGRAREMGNHFYSKL